MTVMAEIRETMAAAIERCGHRVVGVGPGWGLGSGIVIDDDQVVTNAHNVPSEETPVRFEGGAERTGRVIARDLDGDLALLGVETGAVGPFAWSEQPVTHGTLVMALANPGGRGLRVTFGWVSSIGRSFRGPRGRRITGSLEHTAPMARGSSGSPLVDSDGNLVGINTHRLGEGFYLAQPASETLRERLAALSRGQSPRQPHLGIALAPDRAARGLRAAVGLSERDGVLVHAVDPDGPAARAGLRRGDLLVSAAGRALVRTDDLLEALAAHPPGEPLELGVIRGDDDVRVEVTPEEAV